ncbi:MAG TPA: glycosyltransferase family 2 protein [Acidobacteriota bacterium]|nr:glycosyltransferase family 2 protein [Acidobacteriota bacterium]
MKKISIIVPLYNEKESLPFLYEELTEVLRSCTEDYELIFVDDGSTDGSFQILRDLQERDARIRLIRLRRNFGKSAALSAGFRLSEGTIIVTIDADLQDRPSELPKLLGRLEGGVDLVSGWKKPRRDPLRKKIPSLIFNRVTSFLTGVPLHDINCGFKVYRREVIEEIKVYGEMYRYIPILASYRGFIVDEVPVEHSPRRFGKSKFGASRLVGGFFDLITVIMLTRYNKKPLHVFGVLGASLFLIGLMIEAYLSIGWLFERWIDNRPVFILGVLLLIVGIQFISFGLIGEMIAYSSRRDEDYSVREVVEPEYRSSREMQAPLVRR